METHSNLLELDGILYHRTIRATFATFLLAVNHENRVVARVQMPENGTSSSNGEIRTYLRRSYKIGDLLRVKGVWSTSKKCDDDKMGWNGNRFIISVLDLDDVSRCIVLMEVRHWPIDKCQAWQKESMSFQNNQECKKRQRNLNNEDESDKVYRHGGGIGKRMQGEYLANFLIHLFMFACGASNIPQPSEWAAIRPNHRDQFFKKAICSLNSGSGVIDAAGGSGHVSMALGLLGVKSTIVDPRENVGKLPGKDRKVWNRSLRKSGVTQSFNVIPSCVPIAVPFESLRAWFATKPDGVDTRFRHPDEETIEVCSEDHYLLENYSAVVALHPDEATDLVVDMAIRKKVPFVIVPCCVFSRLFPNRRLRNSNQTVNTYDDLIRYLLEKDANIQQTILPFEGANIALWATFS
jgi:hypothetical protein